MCQNENEDENQSFGSFWNLCMTNKPILQCIVVLRACFIRHRLYPKRTKTFDFGFVFVFFVAHEQPVTVIYHITDYFKSQGNLCLIVDAHGAVT